MDRFIGIDWNDDRRSWINLTNEFRSVFTDAGNVLTIQLVAHSWAAMLQVVELHGGVVGDSRELVFKRAELVVLFAGHVHPHVLRHVVQRAFLPFETAVCVLLDLAVLRFCVRCDFRLELDEIPVESFVIKVDWFSFDFSHTVATLPNL